jgi:hypothetical protein
MPREIILEFIVLSFHLVGGNRDFTGPFARVATASIVPAQASISLQFLAVFRRLRNPRVPRLNRFFWGFPRWPLGAANLADNDRVSAWCFPDRLRVA